MSSQETEEHIYDDDFDLKEFISVIWKGKKFIVFISVIVSLITTIFVLQIDDYYISEALLIPSEETSNRAQGVSSLASLAGIDIGSGSPDKTKEALAVLTSRKFVVDFIENHNLAVPILATKGIDRESGELIIDDEIFNTKTNTWVKEPNISEAYRIFISEHYSVTSDILGSGLITVRIQFISPDLAKKWTDMIVEGINKSFKEKEIIEANRSISYLNTKLEEQNLTLDLKKVLYQLIQEQTNLLVLANGREEFMFRTVDPAYVADRKAGPLRSVYVILSFCVGAMISIFSLFLAFYNNRKIDLQRKFPWAVVNKI
tara:strand:+ start:108 stop:1055 length:948 start_codon:yes stop_codon:yes gene_type:complete